MKKEKRNYQSEKKNILKKSKLDEFKLKLEDKGWYYIEENADFYGYKFNLVAETRYLIGRRWHLLILFTDRIDSSNIEHFHTQYHELFKRFDKLYGDCFAYCVIAKEVEPSIIKNTTWKILSGSDRPRGGGTIFFLDLNNGKNYGNLFTVPIDLGRYSKEISGLLNWLIKEKKKNYFDDDYSIDYLIPYKRYGPLAFFLSFLVVIVVFISLIILFDRLEEDPLISLGCLVIIILAIYLIRKYQKKYVTL